MPIDTTVLCESNGCKCIGLQINPWLSGANRYVQCYRSNVMPNHDVVPHNGIECKCNAMLSNAHAQIGNAKHSKTTMYTRIPWKLKNFTVPMQSPILPFNLLQSLPLNSTCAMRRPYTFVAVSNAICCNHGCKCNAMQIYATHPMQCTTAMQCYVSKLGMHCKSLTVLTCYACYPMNTTQYGAIQS